MRRLSQLPFFQRFWEVAGAVSIRVKVLGIVLGVIVLLGLFVTLQMRQVLTQTLRQDLIEQGHALNQQFTNEVLTYLESDDLNTLELYLVDRQIHYSSDGHNTLVAYIQLEDTQNEVLASARSLELVESTPVDDIVEILTPVDETDLRLRLGLAKANIYQTVTEVTFQLLIITLVMVAVGFAAAFFLTWILTQPIYQLVAATRAVAKGDFSQRVPRWANDELGDLAVAFNAMTVSLAQADQERAERERMRSQYVSQVIVAQEDERKRIARELHDSTGQSLTSLLVGLKNLKEADDSGDSAQRIEELRSVVSSTLDEVRTMAWQLRPSALDDLGLTVALHRYIEDYQKRYGTQVDFLASGIDDRLPMEMESSIYRVVQEALTNIARHAHASAASVIIDRRRNAIRIIVEDNGVGFDLQAVQGGKSLGLQGIRERAALFNGQVTIETQPGQGTTLYIEFPIP